MLTFGPGLTLDNCPPLPAATPFEVMAQIVYPGKHLDREGMSVGPDGGGTAIRDTGGIGWSGDDGSGS